MCLIEKDEPFIPALTLKKDNGERFSIPRSSRLNLRNFSIFNVTNIKFKNNLMTNSSASTEESGNTVTLRARLSRKNVISKLKNI